MSQQNPEQIRADIEATRARLGSDVDAVTEKVTPENVVDRQKNKLRGKVQDVREHLMGSTDELGDQAAHRADQARDAVSNAPQTVKAKTRGNPLAAGLIALGAGWLVGSLLPSSHKEQDLVADAAERIQPHARQAVDSAKDAAQDIAQDLKEPAQQAAQSVKETAQSGAQEVKSQGRHEAGHLKSSAQDSARSVKDDTSKA